MPRAKLFHRLSVRLAATILILSLIALASLTEVARRAIERLLLQQAEVHATLAVAAVTDGLDNIIGAAERTARLVARDLAENHISAAEAERRARDLLLDSPDIQGASVARTAPSGTAIAIEVYRDDTPERFTTRDLTTGGSAAWPAPWYREVTEKGVSVWSEPFLDTANGDRQSVRIAVPILRDPEGARETVGAVALVLDLAWLRRLANLQEFSDTSHTIVFSRTGRLILHPKPNYAVAESLETLAAKTGAPDMLAIRTAVLARRTGSLVYQETAPSRRVHAYYKPARHAGWGVMVGFDEAEFLKIQSSYRAITYSVYGLLLIVLAAIVTISVHLALRPLAQLADAADEIAARNLDCKVPEPRRDDEVGHLARAFIAMRDALKAEHLERRWASQALEHQLRYNALIVDSMHEMVFVLTKALNISRVNPATLRLSGHEEADLLKSPVTDFVLLPEGPEATAQQMKDALGKKQVLEKMSATVKHRDGRLLAVSLTFVPIRDAGRVVGGVVTLHSPVPPSA